LLAGGFYISALIGLLKVMTRKEFDLIVDTVGKEIGSNCPENFRILMWGKYKNYEPKVFTVLIWVTIQAIADKKSEFFKHINS